MNSTLDQGNERSTSWRASTEADIKRLYASNRAEAVSVLDELRRFNEGRDVPTMHVLVSRQGPWTGPGLSSIWWKACQKAGADKHFHDLRGDALSNGPA